MDRTWTGQINEIGFKLFKIQLFVISGAFKRLDFPDPPTINNYVRYDVEDFGEITEFSVSFWVREYEDQVQKPRYIFSYSSGAGKTDEITIGRNVEANLVDICLSGFCYSRDGSNMICKLIVWYPCLDWDFQLSN